MLCLRCIRSGLAPAQSLRQATGQLGRQTNLQQSRPLSILSRLTTRPLAPSSSARSAIADDIPSTSFTQASSISQPLLQVRGAKRDTFNPSHIVRKRRHGFLARLRSKNGRKVLKRRRLKGRNTLSH